MPSSPDITTDATATFAAYDELATKTDDTAVADSDLDEIAGAAVPNFYDTCLKQINEVCLGSKALTAAGVTLRVAGAPGTGYSSSFDDMGVGSGSGNRGVTVRIGLNALGGYIIGTSGNSTAGGVVYDDNDDTLWLRANGANRFGSTAAAFFSASAGTLGTASLPWGDVYSNGNVNFTDTDARFSINGTQELGLSSGFLYPVTNGGLALGGASNGYLGAYLAAQSEPASPSSGRVAIYLDTSDGDLKAKDSSGNVVTIANFP